MLRALSAAALFLTLPVCVSQTLLPKGVRIALTAEHAGRTVELRQSCYYGDLYDENEKWLLSPHPFAGTYHIVDFDGEPIHPRGQRGIVPAGTRFTILDVEFPDMATLSMRMLTTPRYNPWVYLRPAAGTELPRDRAAFILLLPMNLETRDQVEAALEELVAPVGEVTSWLAERPPTVQVAIRHKDAIVGMTEVDLVAALGKPKRWFADSHDGKRARIAWYPSREAWLVSNAVVAVKAARDPARRSAAGGGARTREAAGDP